MKRLLLAACLALAGAPVPLAAQTPEQMPPQTPAQQTTAAELPADLTTPATYGALRYDSLLHAMPEYGAMQIRLKQLRDKYAAETVYNEQNFRRLFAEFLQGQKDFPQNIMLKRQRDLQDAMERGMAFRHEADSLLKAAEADMVYPIRLMLDDAIRAVGLERGYECIVNRDSNTLPFLHPAVTEDATPFVVAKLNMLRHN